MSHPFEVGKTYRNRVGEYVVQSIEGEQMTIRYVSGATGTLETSVAIQTRIWENIQFEEQMVRAEERQRQAREARLATRKRTTRAKRAKAKPSFAGFERSDFEPRKRGIAWSSREPLGKVLAYELGQRVKGEFGQWIVPRQSEVHVARKDDYDRNTRHRNAALFVAVNEQGLFFGFRVGKPDGKVKDDWPWSALLVALSDGQKVRRALRAAMKKHELSLDVYVEETSYRQVGQISVQDRGFLWEHETAEQEITRRMDWAQLVEYLETVASDKRGDLFLRKYVSVDAALQAGAAISAVITTVFETLLPVYDACAGG